MEERENDILIVEPEEESFEYNEDEWQENYNSSQNSSTLLNDKKDEQDEQKTVADEKNETIEKEAKTFTNYNFSNLNKVYKKYNVIETYVPKKQEKPKQNKQFEKFVDEQHNYSPERETVVLEKIDRKSEPSAKPKSKAWLVSIIIIFAMLAGLSIYNGVHINTLNNQINQTTTSINNVNNDIKQVIKNIDELTNEDSVLRKAEELGLKEVSDENKVEIELKEKNEVKDYESQTNFFDKICNFFRRLFGG